MDAITAVDRHLQAREADGFIRARDVAASAHIGFTSWDKAALTAFVKGDPKALSELVEDARLLAQALVDDGDNSRSRLAARGVASSRAQQRVLEVLLADRLAARDEDAVAMVSKALDGVTRRLSVWLKHLQVEAALRRRPVVLINNAEKVSVR